MAYPLHGALDEAYFLLSKTGEKIYILWFVRGDNGWGVRTDAGVEAFGVERGCSWVLM